MKKNYEPIPFTKNDDRLFLLKFSAGFLSSFDMEFTQLDLLQIMKHLRGRNDRLYDKFLRVIKEADKTEGTKTDLERKVPQRRYNGKF